jgi:hypothetical protein
MVDGMVLKRNLATWRKDGRLRMGRKNGRWNGFEEKLSHVEKG